MAHLEKTPSRISVEDVGDGVALLDIAQRVPWRTALQVLRALEEDRTFD